MSSVCNEEKLNHPHVGKKRTLIMFAYYFAPSNITGAARPTRFSKYFGRYGFEPQVITTTAQPVPVPGVHCIPDRVRDLVDSTGRHSTVGSYVELLIRKLFLPGEEGLMWAREAAGRAASLIPANEEAFVYSTSPPLATHVAALLLKARKRVRWIADFRDPLVGNPFRRRMPVPLDQPIESMIFRQADLVIANTDTVAGEWKRRYPEHVSKIRTVWNGFDPERMLIPQPLPPRDFRMLVHAGALYGGRWPGALLRSLSRLIRNGLINPASVRLVLLGPVQEGTEQDREVVEELTKLGTLDYRPYSAPKAEAENLAAQAESLLLIDLNSKGAALQVPAKLFEYLQLGRPILALTTADSPSDRILAGSGLAYRSIYTSDTDEQTDAKVLDFFSLPADVVPMDTLVRKRFDSSEQVRELSAELSQLRSE